MASGDFKWGTRTLAPRPQSKSSLNFEEVQKLVRQLKLEAELRERPIILAEQKPSGAWETKIAKSSEFLWESSPPKILELGSFIGSGEEPQFSKEAPLFFHPSRHHREWRIPPKEDVQQSPETSVAQAGHPAPLGEDGPIKDRGIEFYSMEFQNKTDMSDPKQVAEVFESAILEKMLRCLYLLRQLDPNEELIIRAWGRWLFLQTDIEGAKK